MVVSIGLKELCFWKKMHEFFLLRFFPTPVSREAFLNRKAAWVALCLYQGDRDCICPAHTRPHLLSLVERLIGNVPLLITAGHFFYTHFKIVIGIKLLSNSQRLHYICANGENRRIHKPTGFQLLCWN
jgi:hypothetical protein